MATQPPSGDGLHRWLLGGLVVGAIVLGLLVAAYEIGYNRGQDANQPSAAPPPAETTETTATEADAAAAGKELFVSDGCSSCHSLNGSAGVGPTVTGLAGSQVELTDGSTVTADASYLTNSILDADAQIVAGYQKGVMSAAVGSFDFANRPDDVAALVAFMESQGRQ
jgi:cytochrome c2